MTLPKASRSNDRVLKGILLPQCLKRLKSLLMDYLGCGVFVLQGIPEAESKSDAHLGIFIY